MLTLADIVWLGLIAFAISHWWRARGFKALALKLAAERCRELEVQLLDQSVVLHRIAVQRTAHGLLQLRRTYGFEFSSTGSERYKGRLVLLGKTLLGLEMEAHVLQEH